MKFDYAPLWRQRINMVIFKAWFGRRRYIALPIQQLTQPGDTLLFGFGSLVLVRIAGFLITPMRSHTKFGKLMHRACTDLNFHRTSVRIGHHSVQRLVPVGLGIGDVVVVFLREHCEVFVHQRKHFVAVLHRINDDAHRTDIKQLIETQVLADHLFVDGINVFRATAHFGFNAVGLQQHLDAFDTTTHKGKTLLTRFVELFGNLVVDFGFRKAQGQILELPLHLPDTQTISQGRVKS